MQKGLLLTLTLAIIIITSYFVIIFEKDKNSSSPPKTEMDTAVNQAKHIYNQRKAQGTDFLSGPCLSDALMPDWVLDIAHNPRERIDDLPSNQCPSFIEGRAKHFVELDLEGNLIRAR